MAKLPDSRPRPHLIGNIERARGLVLFDRRRALDDAAHFYQEKGTTIKDAGDMVATKRKPPSRRKRSRLAYFMRKSLDVLLDFKDLL